MIEKIFQNNNCFSYCSCRPYRSVSLTAHFRLSETEKSEIESGAEQNENESPSQVAKEIVDSLQNKIGSEKERMEKSESLEQNKNAEQLEDIASTSKQNTAVPIEVAVKEIDEVYRWSNSDKINPTITLAANVDKIIKITNPTDTKHEFVIESNGKEVAASGDVVPESSKQFTFKLEAVGTYEYHCEYHPDTMKGMIIVP